jgi:hypothetical protein
MNHGAERVGAMVRGGVHSKTEYIISISQRREYYDREISICAAGLFVLADSVESRLCFHADAEMDDNKEH